MQNEWSSGFCFLASNQVVANQVFALKSKLVKCISCVDCLFYKMISFWSTMNEIVGYHPLPLSNSPNEINTFFGVFHPHPTLTAHTICTPNPHVRLMVTLSLSYGGWHTLRAWPYYSRPQYKPTTPTTLHSLAWNFHRTDHWLPWPASYGVLSCPKHSHTSPKQKAVHPQGKAMMGSG